MSRKTAGLIAFGIIVFIIYIFGLDFYNHVWTFPSRRAIPLMVLALVGTGVFATIKLNFPQIRYLWHGIKVTRGVYDNPEDEGDLNHFRALTTALSATVGIGNIAGVATALYYGGPGALFWMWVTAFFGTTLKFAECSLSMKYRTIDEDGHTAGGPMYTIEQGLGRNWRWLAVAFASFAVICSFATGNAIQSFTVSDQLYSEMEQILGNAHFLTLKHSLWAGFEVSWQQVINGLLMATVVGMVIIGGIRRIGHVTGFLAPIMAVIYVLSALTILLANFGELGRSLGMVFQWAFNPPAQLAGVGGGTFLVIMNTMLWGIKRGLYSNEAGQGSAAIAHSTAKTKFPIREGTVAMLGPFIDTLIICSLTGLVIISTGAWHHTEFFLTRINPDFTGELYNSSLLTSFAFKEGLSFLFGGGDKIITLTVLLFAVSTAISWSYYGDRATKYLFGNRAIIYYKWLFLVFIFIGGVAELEPIWAFGDAALGFMTFPNLISIILLSGVLKRMTREYFDHTNKQWEQR